MKEENPLWEKFIESLERNIDEYFDGYCKIVRNRNAKLAKVWKKLEEHGVNDEEIEEIQDLLFDAGWMIYVSAIPARAYEETVKMSLDTIYRWKEEYKQAIEDFLRRTESIPIIDFTQVDIKELMIQQLNQQQFVEKIAEYQQEFLDLMAKKKSELEVKPYPGGDDPHRMPIFRSLIGKLGEMLNPFFRGYIVMPSEDRENPERLKMPAAKVIAELLNGYFINLKVNFNPDQVRKRYNSWLEKKE